MTLASVTYINPSHACSVGLNPLPGTVAGRKNSTQVQKMSGIKSAAPLARLRAAHLIIVARC